MSTHLLQYHWRLQQKLTTDLENTVGTENYIYISKVELMVGVKRMQ